MLVESKLPWPLITEGSDVKVFSVWWTPIQWSVGEGGFSEQDKTLNRPIKRARSVCGYQFIYWKPGWPVCICSQRPSPLFCFVVLIKTIGRKKKKKTVVKTSAHTYVKAHAQMWSGNDFCSEYQLQSCLAHEAFLFFRVPDRELCTRRGVPTEKTNAVKNRFWNRRSSHEWSRGHSGGCQNSEGKKSEWCCRELNKRTLSVMLRPAPTAPRLTTCGSTC